MWLNKFLSLSGLGSRRKCNEIIKSGCVKINNLQTVNPAIKITNQIVTVNNKIIKILVPKLFLYYKKPKYIVSHSDRFRKTIFEDTMDNLISVGRLDYYTEGLMLLTNNSTLAHFWETSKSSREYCIISDAKISHWNEYYTINCINYGPIKLSSIINTNKYSYVVIKMYEGKNREIRNIWKYKGWKIYKLIRISFGPFSINHIQSKLTEVQIDSNWLK